MGGIKYGILYAVILGEPGQTDQQFLKRKKIRISVPAVHLDVARPFSARQHSSRNKKTVFPQDGEKHALFI
jgi:hypothetical protein